MFNIAAFLSYVFVMTFTPGPNNIMSMTFANQDGFRKTQRFILGVASGFMILMLLCSYFNLLLYSYLPKIKIVMDIIGAVYMLFLAAKIILSKPHSDNKKDSRLNAFIPGALLQFVNPKGVLFGLTVAGSFIMPYFRSGLIIFLIDLFMAAICYLSVSCWAASGVLFQKLLSKYQKPFNIIMGLLLVYCAISLFL